MKTNIKKIEMLFSLEFDICTTKQMTKQTYKQTNKQMKKNTKKIKMLFSSEFDACTTKQMSKAEGCKCVDGISAKYIEIITVTS